jgi:hypothetical protein
LVVTLLGRVIPGAGSTWSPPEKGAAAQRVIGELGLVRQRVGDENMQLSKNKSKSKAPPATWRDR